MVAENLLYISTRKPQNFCNKRQKRFQRNSHTKNLCGICMIKQSCIDGIQIVYCFNNCLLYYSYKVKIKRNILVTLLESHYTALANVLKGSFFKKSEKSEKKQTSAGSLDSFLFWILINKFVSLKILTHAQTADLCTHRMKK